MLLQGLKQGKIDKIVLEYIDIEYEGRWIEELKLKPNGSVIVHPYKEKTYTREEFWEGLKEGWRLGRQMHYSQEELEEWFNKHYPQ